MINHNPLLTVAIPNYNGGDNLLRAINSCKNIDIAIENYEILIVDNQSTDNSIDIIKTCQDDHPNIRLEINNENLGRINNWNKTIEKARGKYLIFLFSNDEINNDNNISYCLDEMNKEGLNLCMSPLIKSDNSSREIRRTYNEKILKVNHLEYCKYNLQNFIMPFGPIQSNIYNLDLLRNLNLLFDEELEWIGDQMFTFEYLLQQNSPILLNNTPQIIWHLNTNRFHNKVTINKVIKDDLELIETLNNKFNLKINNARVIANGFIKVFINRDYNKTDQKVALDYLWSSSSGYKISMLMNIFISLTRKLMSKLGVYKQPLFKD